MAKVVIAGTCDCPYFARIELLADKLARNLPNFTVTKIIKQPEEWKDFTRWLEKEHGWNVGKSPVVWRELLNQGGSGTLIGGSNEFQEYVAAYYNEYSQMSTKEMCKVANDNTVFKTAEQVEKKIIDEKRIPPSTILVIGACSPPATYLLPQLVSHGIFGSNEYIALDLYDDDDAEHLKDLSDVLIGEMTLKMLTEVRVVRDIIPSLKVAKQIIFLNVVPRIQLGFEESTGSSPKTTPTVMDGRKFEPRDHWLQRRYAYFTSIGLLIQTHCVPTVRVLVTGNPGLDADSTKVSSPVNFDVAVLHKAVFPRISPRQIVGLVSPVVQRAKASVAQNLQVSTHDITDIIVWGNIGGRTYIDLSRSRVFRRRASDVGLTAGPWFSMPTLEAVRDVEWMFEGMPRDVFYERSAAIPVYRGLSHAQSIFSFLRGWWTGDFGTRDQIISLVVSSEDWYGVPKGVVFSFPVIPTQTASWVVAEDVDVSQLNAAELEACLQDVLQDWAVVDSAPLDAFLEKKRSHLKPEDEVSVAEDEED